jgi:ATP-dependent DNA helicase RecG
VLLIHYPRNENDHIQAANRIKFDELFFLQLRLLRNRMTRREQLPGMVFETVGDYFHGVLPKKTGL